MSKQVVEKTIWVYGVDEARLERINLAEKLLANAAPSHYVKYRAEVDVIRYSPGGCGDGVACTGGRFGRTAVLAVDPMRTSIIEIALSLWHEAAHHQTDWHGQHYIFEHTCNDCTDPEERKKDPIYVEEERLRDILVAFLYPKPAEPSVLEQVLKGLAIGAGVVVVGVGLGALAGVVAEAIAPSGRA